MTVARRDWVVKSNDLINARYDWTALQQRMILLMIAQLSAGDEDFGVQRIDIADLVDRSGLSSNAYYERAAEAAEVLLDQKIFVRTDAGRWRGYNLLSFVEPHPGHINARFNPDMRPFLLQLKRRFTRYILGHVLRFQSPYSVRIYEMAMQFQDIGHRTLPLDDLRETLDVATKYPRFYDFKRRILDQAVKEIARHTDHVVTYDVVKDGRTPVAVTLHIRRKADGEAAPGEQTALNLSSETEPLEQGARPYAGVPADDADGRAFRSWWRARTDAERAQHEAAARDRLDPYSRKADPASIVYQTSFREALLAVWRERNHRGRRLSPRLAAPPPPPSAHGGGGLAHHPPAQAPRRPAYWWSGSPAEVAGAQTRDGGRPAVTAALGTLPPPPRWPPGTPRSCSGPSARPPSAA